MKNFYRVSNIESEQGLWYDFKGNFTGLIHKDFAFCSNSGLAMDFDPDVVDWLSAVESIRDLHTWFTERDIKRLQELGWYIHEYECNDWRFYTKFQHWLIKKDTSKPVKRIILL